MPPLPLAVLLALYWSRHVCIRALPSLSFEYLGATADGKTALPMGAAGGDAGRAASFFSDFGGAVVVLVGAAVGAAVASDPHSALRKSFQFMPFSVPAVWAALYLA